MRSAKTFACHTWAFDRETMTLSPYAWALEPKSSMLDDLKARITAYDVAVKEVASGMAERVGAKTAVSDLFMQADGVLKEELDPMMLIFRVTDPEFYSRRRKNVIGPRGAIPFCSRFSAARVIKDIGVKHTKNNTAAKTPAPGAPN